MKSAAALIALALLAAACGDGGAPSGSSIPLGPGTTSSTSTTAPPTTDPQAPLAGLALEIIAENAGQVLAIAAPPGDDQVFLAVKEGFVLEAGDGRTFLDITDRVGAGSLEQGLLGLAFHPGYAANGRLFVNYTDHAGDTVVAEFQAGAETADAGSERVLLTVDQPAANHNGGMVAFGPDGYLWVALGDGGGAADQFANGQAVDTLLAALLRIDVDAAEPYAIPPSNPYVAGGGAAEVWASGLRNPWRFAFDQGLVYVADVGQAEWEEVDVVAASAAGLNYGWPVVEGPACFAEPECDPSGFVEPVVAYDHREGCSITGGLVYRGRAIPELAGHYFYGDWCGGWVRSFRYEDGAAVDRRDWSSDLGVLDQILTFGVDGDGELLVATGDGAVRRIVPER